MKKHSVHDDLLFAEWDRLAFRRYEPEHRPLSKEAYLEQTRRDAPEWEALLAKAWHSGRWTIGPDTAAAISGSLWYDAMILGDPAKAVMIMDRCLEHPGPFDRGSRADLLIQRWVAAFAISRDPEACEALRRLIHNGPYRASTMAKSILQTLSTFLEDLTKAGTPSAEAQALLYDLAIARRAPKRMQITVADWEAYDDMVFALRER